ncbi:exodeoxyribonuclease VII large subunit [Sulfoacidibacillus ferrooxidans]|uniref:Exodeoxyribonuclease 7 large subunit n=1 Tax=Sulfoacidibacillus ferrooxidans TaxID=2005001 RepID=A0A9X1V8C1_9BACL|nr:exodeoxyribonuclease VII large subunit [Sulfoacidibacillus ferrooxidans]MCI0183138.1 Exodeoxyribonuclease 7 large subunit [Sulfoacidibacillus ferrooxidans]
MQWEVRSIETVYTVYEATTILKRVIQSSPDLSQIFIRGEISNVSRPVSGHLYFTLKDDRARLRVVMFASRAKLLQFQMRDGMNIIVQGSIDVFERLGDYQFYAENAQPDGLGALYLAFEQLKERLDKEGLFSPQRKRPLPVYPKRIALVTSATGAAVRDMIITLSRRYPIARVYVIPVAVQGEDAPKQIAKGIELVDHYNLADVIIVGRGGGSLEELFAFNSEIVARAIAATQLPIISAVGHETDVTIADFVADVRAATPTAAAELVAPDIRELHSRIDMFEQSMQTRISMHIGRLQQRVDYLAEHRMLKDPMRMVSVLHERIDRLEPRLRLSLRDTVERGIKITTQLELRMARCSPNGQVSLMRVRLDTLQERQLRAIQKRLEIADQTINRLISSLELLSPLAVLKRGYAVTYRAAEHGVITSVGQVQPGESLHIKFIDGWLDCQVWGVYEDDETSK